MCRFCSLYAPSVGTDRPRMVAVAISGRKPAPSPLATAPRSNSHFETRLRSHNWVCFSLRPHFGPRNGENWLCLARMMTPARAESSLRIWEVFARRRGCPLASAIARLLQIDHREHLIGIQALCRILLSNKLTLPRGVKEKIERFGKPLPVAAGRSRARSTRLPG